MSRAWVSFRLIATTFILALLVLSSTIVQVYAAIDWTREDQYLNIALENIEINRKVDVNLRLTEDPSGQPVADAAVSYKQLSHDFLFAVAGADVAGTTLSLDAFEIWPLNWSYIEPQEGLFNFQMYDAYLQHLESRTPNGQFFVKMWVVPEAGWIYETWPPSYAHFDRISDPDVFSEFLEHMYDFVYHSALHFKGRIRFWIIQMEMNAPIYAFAEAGRLLWTVQQGVEIDFVAAKAIRDANPDAVVLIGTSNPTHEGVTEGLADPLDFTQMCLARGVDFDGVAIEAWPIADTPADYYDYIGMFADLEKCVFIHETQGFAAQPYPWASGWKWNDFNEDAQAEWLRRIFTIAYGSRATIGVQWLWYRDSQAYQQGEFYANGLLDYNGQPRKAYHEFRELIQRFTSNGTATTDSNGVTGLRVFPGIYEITVLGYETVTVHVTDSGENDCDLRLVRLPYAANIDNIDLVPDPSNVGQSSKMVYTITVQNTGINDISSAKVQVKIYMPGIGTPASSPYKYIMSFKAGTERTVNVTYTLSSSAPLGYWTYSVNVYRGSTLLDQVADQGFTVQPPVKTGEILSVTADPDPVGAGGATAFTVVFKNTGNIIWSTAKLTAKIYKPDSTTPYTTRYRTVSKIAPNVEYSYQVKWKPSSSAPLGTYTYDVYLTYRSTVLDSSISNTVTVAPIVKTGKITSVTDAPDPVTRGETATFTVTVKNTGNFIWSSGKVKVKIYKPGSTSVYTTKSLSISNIAPGVEYAHDVKWAVSSTATTGAYRYDVYFYYGASTLMDSDEGNPSNTVTVN